MRTAFLSHGTLPKPCSPANALQPKRPSAVCGQQYAAPPPASAGGIRHEHVASLGSVPSSPSVADRIAFWRRVYEQLAELSNRIDVEAQGKIIIALNSRIPMVTADEQRALNASPRSRKQKAPRRHEVDQHPESEAKGGKAADRAELGKERITHVERGENVEGGLGSTICR
jgi:hypothetical protein